MAILSLQEIRDAADITEKTVPVPEWGGEVVVRSISKRQMNDMKKRVKHGDDEIDEAALEREIFIAGMVNPAVTEADYEWLQDKSAAAMNTVTQAILGQSKEGEDAVKQEEKQFPSE